MKSKPLCVIVDDEEYALAALRTMIEDLKLLEVERCFDDPDRFLTQIDELEAKVIFLDMEMPISGINVARKLEGKQVIFVSGYKERAYETYDVRAVDFVPKPIRASRLKEAIAKALVKLKPSVIVVKTANASKEEIEPHTILSIYTADEDSRDKEICLVSGRRVRVKNKNFDFFLNSLPSQHVQVNSKTIVNTEYIVQMIDRYTLGLKNGNGESVDPISLGDSYREAFFSQKPHLK